MGKFRKASFCMEAINGVFEGFTDGDTWNGWACPYFEFSEAKRALEASKKNGFAWTFNESEDAFRIHNDQDLQEDDDYVVGAEVIDVDGELIKTYPVGAYNWIWEECMG